MNLRDIQSPIKARYKASSGAAKLTLVARSSRMPAEAMSCSVDIGRAVYEAQAHSGVGGSGTAPCSGDLLLGALAACAQITVQMVAAAMGLALDNIEVVVEGDLDLRGTLGMDSSVPVGFQEIRCTMHVAGNLTERQRTMLRQTAEKYCVVLATLTAPPKIDLSWVGAPAGDSGH